MQTDVLNGNALIVRGGLEAGFSLYTGYPGSPMADYFNILHRMKGVLAAKGIRVAIANSEANAAAMASGAKQAGRDCMVVMKSMGLHVAADALSVGNFANPGPVYQGEGGEPCYPGTVVVVGDDPWSISTSTPADSRYLFEHLHIPFLEPSNPQELKDWVKKALEISRRCSVYQGLLLTTFMAEGGGRVRLYPEARVPGGRELLDPESFDLSRNVMVPPNSLKADVRMIEERFPRLREAYLDAKLDALYGDEASKVGALSSGAAFETLAQAMREGGLFGKMSLYKVAGSFPLVEDSLLAYLRGLDILVVVEEKRGFLEGAIRTLVQKYGLELKIYGKRFGDAEGFPAYGGLNFEIVAEKLDIFCRLVGFGTVPVAPKCPPGFGSLPKRFPTFCPGCPHRESLSVLKEVRRVLDAKGIALLSHGDVGCYSLAFLPPFKEMHNLSAMGQGGALGAGVDIFAGNPSVVLMGDSTFFHSGIGAISNSVQLGHDITYILLDNDNTAMTGHQMTPVSGVSVEGLARPRQDILAAVQALGVQRALEIDPSDRYFYRNLLLETVEGPGVKVIISKKECALTFHGRARAREREVLASGGSVGKKTFYSIHTQACEDCRVCVEETGCPGLTRVFDAYGTKVSIDPQVCVADSYCTKIKACPSFEKITVFDYLPVRPGAWEDTDSLPSAAKGIDFEAIAAGRDFRIVVTGVGGSGVTTISRVLSEACKAMGGRDDLEFRFVDQKGLAQRNGNVTSHLAIFRKGRSHAPVTPRVSADLLLSPDLLDAATHVGLLRSGALAVVDERYRPPLSLLLDAGGDDFDDEGLLGGFRNRLGDNLVAFAAGDISYALFGKSVYASSMILGAAWQKGALPFGIEDMESAFRACFRRGDCDDNLRAFAVGRRMALGDGGMESKLGIKDSQIPESLYIESIEESLLPWQNAAAVVGRFRRCLERLGARLVGIPRDHLVRYLHDMFIYDGGREVEDFIANAGRLVDLYADEARLARALRTLAKTYFIKDEIFVSHAMISPIKRDGDRNLYGRLGGAYKIEPINRPSFDLWGEKIEFDISPRPWMLKIMRHARFLRKLLGSWHVKERKIAMRIRRALLEEVPGLEEQDKRLRDLENIKGFRDVRYAKARAVLGGGIA